METLLDMIPTNGAFANLVVMALVFIPTALVAFFFMRAVRVRGTVRRRAAGIRTEDLMSGGGSNSLRNSGMKAAQRLLDRTTKHYSSMDNKSMKALRQRLVQAGIFDARAVGFFFLTRGILAVVLGALAFVLVPMLTAKAGLQWPAVGVAGLLGYLGPSLVLDRIVSRRRLEYRAGFPDMMDLLVVCADAGLGMASAFERVGRELGESYPNLSANIHMANLEIRAGRTMSEALEHFGDRLGLVEVRSFATLIQQSAELGSSITDALRVYSEDMRHRRLSTAEEKAYALPSKLAIPLMVCVFPVLFVVILLPVFVRIKMGAY
ncbi:MAG TPA: type II secretion system F family protein [Xanthobacteraceae bacterium]|jgi:tight adherence protein C